ncbi:MAG TPA: DUF4190 domain-containing protein [Candidatus Lumbricidophila sp.]|nr:DUF4190 domain-containing protein [Candidatus Lumbricidophila sp.]
MTEDQTIPAGEPPVAPPAPPAYAAPAYTPPAPPAPPAPQAPSYAPTPGAPQFAPAAPKTNTMAIVAIITVWFGGLWGIIFGHIGLSQIKKSRENGRGLAVAALIIGYVGVILGAIALVVLLVVAAMAAPTITKAVQCVEISRALSADAELTNAMSEIETNPSAAADALDKLVNGLHSAGSKVNDAELKQAVDAAEIALKDFKGSIVDFGKDPASLDQAKFQQQAEAVQTTMADLTTACTPSN